MKHEPSDARARPFPAAHDKAQLLLAADERRQDPRAAPAAAAAHANDAIEIHGLSHAFEVANALLLDGEQSGDLALHVCGDEHRPRLGRRLDARGDIRRIAENLARRVDNHGACREANARREFQCTSTGVPGVEVGDCALDVERGADRTAHGRQDR